jgi:hypothetical protein
MFGVQNYFPVLPKTYLLQKRTAAKFAPFDGLEKSVLCYLSTTGGSGGHGINKPLCSSLHYA